MTILLPLTKLLLSALLPWILFLQPAMPGDDSPYLVTVAAPNASRRTTLAKAGYDITGIDIQSGTVNLLLQGKERAWLREAGWPILQEKRLSDFPPVDAAYHNYNEMLADLNEIAATYPNITQLSVCGRSIEGRHLYTLRISGRPPGQGRPLPGVLYVGNIHAREHLTLEQALWLAHYFTDNYGQDPALTNLVNRREIWILPNVNPDGTEFDVAQGTYRWWRKNRRHNADGSYGVDLNRNFGYRWGGPGASSATTSETYRGRASFSEPETAAIRDFVEQHPNLRTSIFMHTYSELILWPYGYTNEPLPADMKPEDEQIFQTAGKAMAQLNGYRPLQSSQLYVTSGSSDDWLYGTQGIYAWTFELYPTAQSPYGFYPPAIDIKAQVERNREALTYAAAIAADPQNVLGQGDIQPPVITMTVALTSTWAGLPLTVTITATDNTSVTLLALLSDGRPVTMTTSATLTMPIIMPEGTRTLQALAFDHDQNRQESAAVVLIGKQRDSLSHHYWLPIVGRTRSEGYLQQ